METNLDALFKSDLSKEEEGVKFEVSPGISFTVRRFGGKNGTKVKLALAKYYKPYARLIENGSLDEKVSDEISIKVFCAACLVSWEGVTEGGAELPHTLENAIRLFTRLPELFVALNKFASETVNYKEEVGNY